METLGARSVSRGLSAVGDPASWSSPRHFRSFGGTAIRCHAINWREDSVQAAPWPRRVFCLANDCRVIHRENSRPTP